MAGGIVTSNLIAAVGKAGGLGTLPLGYLSVEDSRRMIVETKEKCVHPFGVNIFLSEPKFDVDKNAVHRMIEHINKYRMELGLVPLAQDLGLQKEAGPNEIIDVAVKLGVKHLSFVFGALTEQNIDLLHRKGVFVMGTATSISEGKFLENTGCDAVIAQGYEAGGHRGGGFLGAARDEGLIGTMALVPQMVDAIKVPVVAAGGVFDGRGVVAALALGAQAVQMGTAFLTCHESTASRLHKSMLLDPLPGAVTTLSASFTGKTARGMSNQYVHETEAALAKADLATLPYPLLHQLTTEFRKEANKAANEKYASLWAGQGFSMSRDLSVEELFEAIESEMVQCLDDVRTKLEN
jgi:nitronate monooxygenase